MRETKIWFKSSDRIRLCGLLTKPKDPTDKCIIFCHGITVNKDEYGNVFKKCAHNLARSGYAVFRFDFRGHGESGGNSIDLTVRGETKDLQAATKTVSLLGYKEIGILAASFGAGAALYVAPRYKSIKTIVLWNPTVDYACMLKPKLPWDKKYFGKEAMKRLDKDGFIAIGSLKFKIGKALIKDMRRREPWKELRKIKIPILFMHGDKDSYVPLSDSIKYSKFSRNSSLKIIKGAEHGFHDAKGVYEMKAQNITASFFLKNL